MFWLGYSVHVLLQVDLPSTFLCNNPCVHAQQLWHCGYEEEKNQCTWRRQGLGKELAIPQLFSRLINLGFEVCQVHVNISLPLSDFVALWSYVSNSGVVRQSSYFRSSIASSISLYLTDLLFLFLWHQHWSVLVDAEVSVTLWCESPGKTYTLPLSSFSPAPDKHNDYHKLPTWLHPCPFEHHKCWLSAEHTAMSWISEHCIR